MNQSTSQISIFRFLIFQNVDFNCIRLFSRLRIQQIFVPMLLLLSCFSRVQLCATPETTAHQAPLSLGFSRQEHWSGLPLMTFLISLYLVKIGPLNSYQTELVGEIVITILVMVTVAITEKVIYCHFQIYKCDSLLHSS